MIDGEKILLYDAKGTVLDVLILAGAAIYEGNARMIPVYGSMQRRWVSQYFSILMKNRLGEHVATMNRIV